MTSFINLLTDDVWPDADITARTEAMVARDFPRREEIILNREAWGVTRGLITDPAAVAAIQAREAQFQAATFAAQAEGIAARADNELLKQAVAIERGELASADASQAVLDLVAARAAARTL